VVFAIEEFIKTPPAFSVVLRRGQFNRAFACAQGGVVEEDELNAGIVFELSRKVADSLGAPAVGTDQLLDGDDAPFPLSAIQHRREDFRQGAGDVNDSDRLAGVNRLLDQPFGMLGVTEGRIEYDLRALGNAGYRQRSALSRGVSAGREDYTIPALRRPFGERPPEQLVTNPSGGGV
jgi:hypothetical protein